MSDDEKDTGTGPGEVRSDTAGTEGEAHSRRKALLVLVVVVVLALVAALVVWSVTSARDTGPASAPTSSASAPGMSPSPSASTSTSEAPTDPTPGDVVDGVLGFGDEAPVGDGVTLALSDLEAVDGEASSPGEVGGPSLRFTVTFTNDGDDVYSLLGAVTNVYFGAEQTPAIPLDQPGGVAFPSEVGPGETASGTFVFNVPEDDRGQVRITVDYDAAEPAVVYEGSAPE